MKIALVHDQLQEFGGAERVLVSLMELYPEADIFTSFYNPDSLGIHAKYFENRTIITSWADKVPFFKRLYSPLRFMTPLIWESFNFKGYDLVISSSGSYMSKGIVTRPETTHICYIHHQPRYLYYYETAVEWQKYWPIKVYGHLINHGLRIWDYLGSQRVDHFIANSEETKRRVQKFYRRDSKVIYPPVNVTKKEPETTLSEKQYYITTSRLARAKHVDVLIKAANKYGFQLKVIGRGRDSEYLQSIAGKTVEFLQNVQDEQFEEIYSKAKAFLFASVDEEFGIAAIEAMGFGLPVIAYASGGLIETVDGKNGYLYTELAEDSLIAQVKKLEKLTVSEYSKMSKDARASSLQYSDEEFKKQVREFVKKSK